MLSMWSAYICIHPSALNHLHLSHLSFWLWWQPYARLSAVDAVQTESHQSLRLDVIRVDAEHSRLSIQYDAWAIYLLPLTGDFISILYADASSRCHHTTWTQSGTLMYKLHLSIILNTWQLYTAAECNTLISYDAAQQANKSRGSTLMDCASPSQIHTTFCWGRCVWW